MFGNKYTEEYVEGLRSEIKRLFDKNNEIKVEYENNAKQSQFNHDLEIKRLENLVEEKVKEQVEAVKSKMVEVEKQNAVLTKELEVYTKAFENMGVDVKDMKEIMSELIKGIVSKNTVSVIK